MLREVEHWICKHLRFKDIQNRKTHKTEYKPVKTMTRLNVFDIEAKGDVNNLSI